MKLWNCFSWLRLCLLLHTTGVITVANGAEKHTASSEQTKDGEVSSGGSGTGEELPSHPPHVVETVTRPRSSITRRFANLHLSESGGNGLRRRSDRRSSEQESSVALFPKSVVATFHAGGMQHAHPYEGADPSFLPPPHGEGEGTLCADVAAATKQSGTQRRSSCPTRRYVGIPKPWSFTRGSKIPVIASRSHLFSLNAGSPYESSSRATTGSLVSVRGCASYSLSRPSLKPVQSRLTSTGVSSTCRSARQSDAPLSPTRRWPNPFAACPWRTHEKTLPLPVVAAQPAAEVDSKKLSRSFSVDGKVVDTSTGSHAHRRRKSGALSVEREPSEAFVQCPPCASTGPGSTERSETLLVQDTGFSAAPARGEHRLSHLEEARDTAEAQGSTPRTLVRYHQGTAFPVLDERKFLLNQSVELRYQHLFEVAVPEFVDVAGSLHEASIGISCFEENSMAQVVFDILASVDVLKIRPLSDRRSSAADFTPFQVVPECVLGAGGASLVYQMRVAGDAGERWAVKVHYCWAEGAPDDITFSYICSSTRERVTDVTRYLGRDYTPNALFTKFRFLVPYVSGEFAGLKPVILPHSSDHHKHLLNLVTVMPLMPGSFDTVLSMHELSSPAKRAACFSFVELVAHLHLQNLIHGDLKPANFFLGSNGHVYLGDFDTVGKQNSRRQCGAMATLDFLDPDEARCHIKTPTKRVLLTPSRDAWALGLCLFLVWCGAFPFDFLNRKSELSLEQFVSHMLALIPDADGGDRTTPKLDFQNCPEGAIKDGLVLELIQRFLELDRGRRWTPVAGYKLILSAGDFTSEALQPVFF